MFQWYVNDTGPDDDQSLRRCGLLSQSTCLVNKGSWAQLLPCNYFLFILNFPQSVSLPSTQNLKRHWSTSARSCLSFPRLSKKTVSDLPLSCLWKCIFMIGNWLQPLVPESLSRLNRWLKLRQIHWGIEVSSSEQTHNNQTQTGMRKHWFVWFCSHSLSHNWSVFCPKSLQASTTTKSLWILINRLCFVCNRRTNRSIRVTLCSSRGGRWLQTQLLHRCVGCSDKLRLIRKLLRRITSSKTTNCYFYISVCVQI